MIDINKSDIKKESDNSIRINKYLSDCGICSRRQADDFIKEGKVTINGKLAVIGNKVYPGDVIKYNDKVVKADDELILIAFNKPVGIECTTAADNPDNIVDFIGYKSRIFPIGRLDKNSSGLILLTNRGELSDKILRGSNYHEKEYEVKVNRPVTEKFLKEMSEGVPIMDTVTRPCKIKKTGKYSFNIILTQGLNRQIRRMCEYLDYKVLELKRIRIINIKLGDLKTGTYREVTQEEREGLLKEL